MKKKHHDGEYYGRKSKRSSSPVAEKEELASKRI